jgi:hypothetical protein
LTWLPWEKQMLRLLGPALWVLIVVGIWIMLPPQPRTGWQLSGDQVPAGFLSHGRTVVTASKEQHPWPGGTTRFRGPIQVWNADTGELLASHPTGERLFVRVGVARGLDRLLLEECQSEPG